MKAYFWRDSSLLKNLWVSKKRQYVSFPGDRNRGIVSRLFPYSNYKLEMVVTNGRGDGPRSEVKEFPTPEGGTSSPGLPAPHAGAGTASGSSAQLRRVGQELCGAVMLLGRGSRDGFELQVDGSSRTEALSQGTAPCPCPHRTGDISATTPGANSRHRLIDRPPLRVLLAHLGPG